jgi:Putative DNA-binding domain
MTTPLRTVADLATVTPGFAPKPSERKPSGSYLLLGGRNIKDGELVTTPADSHVDVIDRESFRRAIAQPGDLIVSTLFDRRKLYLYDQDDPPAVVNNSCAIIRAGAQSDYIISYLRTEQGAKDFLKKATKATAGAFIPRVSVHDLLAIEIPILPIEHLARLGDARIKKASTKELLALQRELAARNEEIERLRTEHETVVQFQEDRYRAVTEQLAMNSLASRIKHGETATLEFKSSLRWNLKAGKPDPTMENAVLKTIAAFCNTKGGELLIGVADDQSILGIEHDGFPNNDKFQLHLRNLLLDRIIPSIAGVVEYAMVSIDGKTICHVTCHPSKTELWLKPDKNTPERFYVRVGPSSNELTPRDAVAYIKNHFERRD